MYKYNLHGKEGRDFKGAETVNLGNKIQQMIVIGDNVNLRKGLWKEENYGKRKRFMEKNRLAHTQSGNGVNLNADTVCVCSARR